MESTIAQPRLPLRNDHNVYILGAGFSAEAGLPLVNDFLNRMRDSHPWLVARKRTQEADAVQRVLEFRLAATSAGYWNQVDLENIEELFSLASVPSSGERAATAESIRLAISATLDYASSTSEKLKRSVLVNRLGLQNGFGGKLPGWVNFPENSGSITGEQTFAISRYGLYAARLLGVFDGGSPKGENTFLTFNYDTLLEEGLEHIAVPYSYGFTGNSVEHCSTSKADPDAAIRVLKLHGSVNWEHQDSQSDPQLVIHGTYSDLRCRGVIPHLVPPTWNKTISSHSRTTWSTAVDCLREATRIVVIGFSMPPTDLHFKYLLAAGLQENVSLRSVLFVDPKANQLVERVGQIFRREHVASSKIGFLEAYASSFLEQNDPPFNIGRPLYRDLGSFQVGGG